MQSFPSSWQLQSGTFGLWQRYVCFVVSLICWHRWALVLSIKSICLLFQIPPCFAYCLSSTCIIQNSSLISLPLSLPTFLWWWDVLFIFVLLGKWWIPCNIKSWFNQQLYSNRFPDKHLHVEMKRVKDQRTLCKGYVQDSRRVLLSNVSTRGPYNYIL